MVYILIWNIQSCHKSNQSKYFKCNLRLTLYSFLSISNKTDIECSFAIDALQGLRQAMTHHQAPLANCQYYTPKALSKSDQQFKFELLLFLRSRLVTVAAVVAYPLTVWRNQIRFISPLTLRKSRTSKEEAYKSPLERPKQFRTWSAEACWVWHLEQVAKILCPQRPRDSLVNLPILKLPIELCHSSEQTKNPALCPHIKGRREGSSTPLRRSRGGS